jgi:CHASE2 domain-containing sensor protein
MKWTYPERLAPRILRFIPRIVMETPERVLLNTACALIGVSVLVGTRSPVLDRLWPFPLYEWAILMLVGGGSVLVGMFTRKLSMERLGMILVLVACLFYGTLLLVIFGWPGLLTAVIFYSISVAKAIRLYTSSKARSTSIRLGLQMRDEQRPDGPP